MTATLNKLKEARVKATAAKQYYVATVNATRDNALALLPHAHNETEETYLAQLVGRCDATLRTLQGENLL